MYHASAVVHHCQLKTKFSSLEMFEIKIVFFLFLVYVLRNPKHYNGFVFAIDISFFWWFLLLIVLFCSVCVFLIYVVFLGGVYFLLFKQPTGSFSINSEEATYYKS